MRLRTSAGGEILHIREGISRFLLSIMVIVRLANKEKPFFSLCPYTARVHKSRQAEVVVFPAAQNARFVFDKVH